MKEKALFTLSIQSNSKRLIKGLQFLLLLINITFLTYLILITNHPVKVVQLTLPFFSLLFISYVWKSKQFNVIDKYSKLLLVIGLSFAINWMANFYWLPGIGMIGVSYLFVQAIRPINIHFFKEYIKITTFPSQSYSWKKIDQIILRDQILTLNFTNNRFIQHPVFSTRDFNLEQFNQFCHLHLEQLN